MITTGENQNLRFAFGIIATTTVIAVGTDSCFRNGETILTNPTSAKVHRTGLYALASSLPWVAAHYSNNDTSSLLCSLLGSAACMFGASLIPDYDDVGELNTMRIQACTMDFEKLKQTHGLERLVQHKISPDLQQKFCTKYQGARFSDITRDYSLATIGKYKLCSSEFLRIKFAEELTEGGWNFLNSVDLGDTEYSQILSPKICNELTTLKTERETIETDLQDSLTSLNTTLAQARQIHQDRIAALHNRLKASLLFKSERKE